MNTFMSWVWFVVESALWGLPWALMAGLAAWAFTHKRLGVLAMQALGGACYFFLMPLRWLVLWGLAKTTTPEGVYSAAGTIFSFLQWMALATFAAGFCWEKWKLYKLEKIRAFPVELVKK